MGQIKGTEKKQSRFLPLAGLFLGLCFAVIAYYALAEPVIKYMSTTQFNPYRTGLTLGTLKIAFSVIVFVVMLSVSAMIISAATPKSRVYVNEKELIKERKDAIDYRTKVRKRQRKVNRQMREGK